MPFLKKDAYNAVIAKLGLEQEKLRYGIKENKREMRKLVDKQTSMKRQLGILQELIRSIKTQPD